MTKIQNKLCALFFSKMLFVDLYNRFFLFFLTFIYLFYFIGFRAHVHENKSYIYKYLKYMVNKNKNNQKL